ncbi:MAG: YqgE/AlgH family protein [Cellvibrionales bacterium]|nr:YqgE/AlgH family protein [Cellvibrionales bacterium]
MPPRKQTLPQHPAADALSGSMLAAMPGMADPNFAGTLSLICEHGADGAIGLVLNRPLPVELGALLQRIGLEVPPELAKQTVLAGGPVKPERGFVLHRPDSQKWAASRRVADGLMVTASSDIIDAMAAGRAPAGATLVLGYAGWDAGQLEREMGENSWLSLPAAAEVVFGTACEHRLTRAAALAGIDFGRLASAAGHA